MKLSLGFLPTWSIANELMSTCHHQTFYHTSPCNVSWFVLFCLTLGLLLSFSCHHVWALQPETPRAHYMVLIEAPEMCALVR